MKKSVKRLSAISILMAFMLIASFIAAFVPQAIAPQPAMAETQEVFTSSTTWTVPSGVTSVTVLVVAGGGGGGGAATLAFCGGGGGAGGLIYNANYAVTPGANITISIGNGGNGGSGDNRGSNGGNSVFGTLTAIGGGGGGGGTCAIQGTGSSGGSGGGGAAPSDACNPGSGTSGQGNAGGKGKISNNAAGGGGGNGSTGEQGGTDGSGMGGDGGSGGDYSAIFGTSVGESGVFAGGGGGAGYASGGGGTGGTGGGGDGGCRTGGIGNNGEAGTANTGGGGGGAYSPIGTRTGGSGGSGVVIVKYTANSAPSIGTVALWTTGGSPSETTAMTPQVEYNIKIPVTENDTFNDLVTLKATLYYDSDGTYSEGEVPTTGNTQTCAILTWTKATNTLTIASGTGSSWSVSNASSVFPSLSSTSGTFEFHFTPGKVATYTGGSDNWHIYVKATDSASNTGTGTKTDLTMGWYSEITVNTGTIDWGSLTAGQDFAEGDPSEEAGISATYVCNGAYNQQIKSSTSWTGSPSGSAALNTGGTPGANEFSLKADDDGTLTDAVTVSDAYQTFDTGTITSESGNTEAGNSVWIKMGTPFTKAIYTGTIYFQIAQ